MKAVLCPICRGTGKSYIYFDTCSGCKGKGWVEVHEDITEIPKPKVYPIIFDSTTTVTWTWYTCEPHSNIEIRGTYS